MSKYKVLTYMEERSEYQNIFSQSRKISDP